MIRKRLILLGSTGSIGTRTLDVVRDFPERFEVVALAAGGRVEALARQVAEFRPRAVCVGANSGNGLSPVVRDAAAAVGARVHSGEAGLVELVEEYEADLVLVATVGFVGVRPTLRAVERGIDIALANKEVLVAAGDLVTAAARRSGARLLPVDSEHNAIFQCLAGGGAERGFQAFQRSGVLGGIETDAATPGGCIRRLILTASGGPFRGWSRGELQGIGAEAALKHPTWQMGPKITIDSATLMNKGFEVIEARHLFDVPVERVDVLVHPESTVHSMVEFVDGSVIAQLGVTDMYLPIQNVLMFPERVANGFPPLDLRALGRLTFEEPDRETFPCLDLAYRASRAGGTMPAVLNAANEVAVARFLAGEIGFVRIAELIESVMEVHGGANGGGAARKGSESAAASLDDILEADRWARGVAREFGRVAV